MASASAPLAPLPPLLPGLEERFPQLDFDAFHRETLPAWIAAGRGALAAVPREGTAQGTLALRVPGAGAWSYELRDSSVALVEGDRDAAVCVELGADAWSGLVHELESVPGLLYARRCRVVRGDPMQWMGWEPRLRALYAGRPIHDLSGFELRDAQGRPLDPAMRFGPDDDRAEMAQFLREAGYVVVRGVFDAAQLAQLRAEADALRAQARPGDGRSWWARDAAGRAVLARVIHGGTRERLAALYEDPRIRSLVDLSDHDLVGRRADDYEAVSVLWKNPDVREGLSDLPWHRDCGMGGHAVMCPILIVTIHLTDGNARSGELRMLPGSWRAAVPFFEADDVRAPRGVGLEVEAGDVSLHYGDVMHAAPAPRGAPPHRVSLLLAFTKRGAVAHHRGEGGYNDVLLDREDGQVEHLARVAARSRPGA